MSRSRSLLRWSLIASLLAAPVGAQEAAKKVRELEGWGVAISPDGDCTFQVDPKGQTLTIHVPGSRPHLLSAEVRQYRMNAPRVLRDVSGNFEARVKVVGTLAPNPSATSHYDPYQGAGLLVWHNPGTYVRLERAVSVHDGRKNPYVNYELRQGGRLAITRGFETEDVPLYLRLQRRGDEIIGAYSSDGDHWTTLPPLVSSFPRELKVGVVAINSAKKPLDAVLEQLVITDVPRE